MITDKLKYLCLVILFGMISMTCTKRYFASDIRVQQAVYVQMLEEKSTTTAVLDTNYRLKRTRVPKKLGDITVDKDYEITYWFTVGNEEFSGKYLFDKLPVYRETTVYYLASDPSINTLSPQESIEKATSDYSFNLAMAILFGVLALYFLYRVVQFYQSVGK